MKAVRSVAVVIDLDSRSCPSTRTSSRRSPESSTPRCDGRGNSRAWTGMCPAVRQRCGCRSKSDPLPSSGEGPGKARR